MIELALSLLITSCNSQVFPFKCCQREFFSLFFLLFIHHIICFVDLQMIHSYEMLWFVFSWKGKCWRWWCMSKCELQSSHRGLSRYIFYWHRRFCTPENRNTKTTSEMELPLFLHTLLHRENLWILTSCRQRSKMRSPEIWWVWTPRK